MAVAAAATIAVQLGTYGAARAAIGPGGSAAVLSLLVGLLWIVLAAPIFAAGGAGALDGLLRGAAVLDASAALLIVLAAGGQALTAGGAVKIYLIWCGLGLAESALVLLARRTENRQLAAAAAIVLALAVAASPFWANGVILSAPEPWRGRLTFLLRASNPVFATAGCMPGTAMFVWNQGPILYECTVLRRDVSMPPAAWYVTFGTYAVLAACLGVLTAVRRRP